MRKNRVAASFMLFSLALTACQDLAVSALTGPDESVNRLAAAQGGGEFVCFTSELRPTAGHAYRYSGVALHFPASELAADGKKRAFHLRIQRSGKDPVVTANCMIPNTPAAAQRLYRSLVRMLAKHARFDPLTIPAPVEERRLYIADRRGTTGPRFDTGPQPTYSLPPITATATPVYEGGATGWTGGGDWGWGSQGDTYTYSGGDSYDAPPTPEDCHADLDPRCNQPLTHADSTVIRASLDRYKRPLNQFTDSVAARHCQELLAAFDQALANGQVFRGLYDLPDSTGGHYGETYADSFHIDPTTLNNAEAGDTIAMRDGVAVTALHETGHLMGYRHGLPTWSNHQDYYTEAPFNLLNPGPNSCIVR
ncbi:MAG: hypothetical protein JWM27_3094 [Gemmatimonadetes bacterium]|nr:hypothetical protein [Gemmatimonadota bacterium]